MYKRQDNDSVGVVKKERTLEDVMNLLRTVYDEINDNLNKHFNNMNKGFEELHIELNKTKEIMSKGCDTIKNACDKPDEKREENRGQLKKSTEVELTPVSYTHLDVYKRQLLYCNLKDNASTNIHH